MEHAEVRVNAANGPAVSPYVFGALTEHFGYGLYGGIWDASRATPRADVLGAVRALGTTMFRYPGGCFSDWYHWRDGVGPRDRRPTHERQYWTDFRFGDAFTPEMARRFGPVETNAFGTDEFLQYCLDADAEPMLVANFGTGTPEEAAAWVAYCNRDRAAPRPVRWWSVGNETYGWWELGHCSATEYGRRYVEYAEAMKAVDPDLKLVAVGHTQRPGQPGSGWNADVLREASAHVDALSVHWYFPGPFMGRDLRDDEPDYLQVATAPDELGAALDATMAEIDAVTDRPVPLSLDEWNIWGVWEDLLTTNRRLCDAVFFAGVYNRILERADRVQLAMVSHLVNCMAPIQTRGDRHFVTSAYLTQTLYQRALRANAVDVEVGCGQLKVPAFSDTRPLEFSHADAPVNEPRVADVLDASASRDTGGTTVFLANRGLSAPLSVTVAGLQPGDSGRFRFIAGPGPWARNDEDNPTTLGFRDEPVTVAENGRCDVVVPPHTVGALVVA